MLHDDCKFVQTVEELPPIPAQILNLFLDFETSSGDSSEDSLNPWHHCKPYGVAVTWDNMHEAYYIPYSEAVKPWLMEVMRRSRQWINHNVKYDAHVWQLNVGDLPQHLE